MTEQSKICVISWDGRTSFTADHLGLSSNARMPEDTFCGIRLVSGTRMNVAEKRARTSRRLCKKCERYARVRGWPLPSA